MDESYVIAITGQTIFLILILSSPMLIAALIVGLFIGILQAVTQVQEQTLSFVPKIVATFVALIASAGWISSSIMAFAVQILNSISTFGPK